MTKQRLFQTIKLNLKRGAGSRANYLRSILGDVGENVYFQPRVIPLYPELIKLHNNVLIASGVTFNTHDAIHTVLNNIPNVKQEGVVPEKIGCIEIMDNVFVGSGTSIMYGVRIGPNVIVGAHSVITKDLEPNSVYAGIPARKIGTFDDYVAKRKNNKSIIKTNQHITKEEVDNAWRIFEEEHR